jgi:serine/threonine protein kinase
MLEALACLAKAKVIHCDVKPDNIMRLTPAASSNQESEPDSFRYRLLDFGCSRLDKVDPMFALKEVSASN